MCYSITYPYTDFNGAVVKFGNRSTISCHPLLCIRLLTYAGIKVSSCQQIGPKNLIIIICGNGLTSVRPQPITWINDTLGSEKNLGQFQAPMVKGNRIIIGLYQGYIKLNCRTRLARTLFFEVKKWQRPFTIPSSQEGFAESLYYHNHVIPSAIKNTGCILVIWPHPRGLFCSHSICVRYKAWIRNYIP